MNTCFQEKYVFLFFFLLKTLIDMYFRHMVLTCFSIIWKCILTLIWGSSLEVDNRLSDKCCLVDLPMKDTTICILIIRLFIQDYVSNKARPSTACNSWKEKFPWGELVLDIESLSLDLIRPDDCTPMLYICTPMLIIYTGTWSFRQELEHLHRSLNICTGVWSFAQ